MKARIITMVSAACMVFALTACDPAYFQAFVATQNAQATEQAQAQVAEDTILGQVSEPGEKYTLYLGLNDKDTYEQMISTEEALDKANQICAKHAGGYTQFSAKGGWTNDDGTMGHENTIVYMLYDISDDDLKALLDELIQEFNQSAVLVEKSENAHIYYSGE